MPSCPEISANSKSFIVNKKLVVGIRGIFRKGAWKMFQEIAKMVNSSYQFARRTCNGLGVSGQHFVRREAESESIYFINYGLCH
jgi:hypothetical protein